MANGNGTWTKIRTIFAIVVIAGGWLYQLAVQAERQKTACKNIANNALQIESNKSRISEREKEAIERRINIENLSKSMDACVRQLEKTTDKTTAINNSVIELTAICTQLVEAVKLSNHP